MKTDNYFSNNLKYIREQRNMSQNKLGELIDVNQTTIARWESQEISPTLDNVYKISKILKINIAELLGKNLKIDNAEIINNKPKIKIPILGRIPAGTPIEAVEDILGYEEIPEEMIKYGNKYFALEINGDSMCPEYRSGDTLIIKQQNDCNSGDDCIVFVNGYDATFKRVIKSNDGIKLKPLNNDYETMKYSIEDIYEKPITILGVAVEVRRKLK